MKNICLLGASGSIGSQTLDIIKKYPNDFCLVAFSVGDRTNKIKHILKMFPNVKSICVKSQKKANNLKKTYQNLNIFSGDQGLNDLIINSDADMIVNALVGFAGLKPSITTLENDKILCLANKETLVVGGELINKLLQDGKGKLIPIDSEHVALAKCLSVDSENVDKLVITGSGGAFRDLSRDQLVDVSAADALNHPTWKMGKKITIDSATMVNKTFEIIEAFYLFSYSFEKIDLLLNPTSFVHSLVKYKDGSFRLDEGKPDMRVPIKYALFEGLIDFKTVHIKSLYDYKKSSFKAFDIGRYPIVNVATDVIKNQGLYGCVFNATNEVAVNAFLNNKIKFLDIEKLIICNMSKIQNIKNPTYSDLLICDKNIRVLTENLINKGDF